MEMNERHVRHGTAPNNMVLSNLTEAATSQEVDEESKLCSANQSATLDLGKHLLSKRHLQALLPDCNVYTVGGEFLNKSYGEMYTFAVLKPDIIIQDRLAAGQIWEFHVQLAAYSYIHPHSTVLDIGP